MNLTWTDRLTEQWIWRKAVDIHRDNNMEGRGDAQTLKVSFEFGANFFSPHDWFVTNKKALILAPFSVLLYAS